jgi:hypothetical protein
LICVIKERCITVVLATLCISFCFVYTLAAPFVECVDSSDTVH